MTSPPKRELAWVRSTPLGLEVVPDVYCIEISSSGATLVPAGVSGGVDGRPRRNGSSGRASITPVRAGQRAATAWTGAAYCGSVTESLASECARMYSISSAVEVGLVGTMTVPVLAAAIQKRRNSGQLPR